MNIVVIMAGGTGQRMAEALNTASNAEKPLPKQFIELENEPILVKTLSKFINSGYFDAFYIGIHEEWADFADKMLENNLKPQDFTKIHLISGGKDRNSTLNNVISAIESDIRDIEASDQAHMSEFAGDLSNFEYGIDPIIVTHDAVRPFVTEKMIEESINAARQYGAATVAIPTTDTIASSASRKNDCDEHIREENIVRSMLDRSTLFNIQTPQSFRLSYYREAYAKLTLDQVSSLTDVCGVFLSAGLNVSIVPGDSSNIKITTPFDLALAKAILSQK